MVEAEDSARGAGKEAELLFGQDRICAVVAATTAREMQAQLRRALKFTSTVELRLDWLKSDLEMMRFTGWLGTQRVRATLIGTCRRLQAGGKLGGRGRKSFVTQLMRLGMAASIGRCGWYDLEAETFERVPPWLLNLTLVEAPAAQGARPRRLVSHHDFQTTPRKLEKIARHLDLLDGDAIKIATQCNSIGDSLRILALTKGRRNVIAVPMGEAGMPARVLALRHGSALAYAPVAEATAPGQVSLEAMKNLYRADKLNRRTRVYGVIGNPVSHSLSPLMHNLGFQARRMNSVYLPFLVRDLNDFLAAIEPLGIAGFSVTLPHKERILRHLHDCDPLAAAIGAVNTVVVRGGGKLYGYNTDYVGVLRALERRVRLAGSRVLLYGAGGAARAVAFALAQGRAVVCVCARRPKQAAALARAVGGEAVRRGRLRREFFDAIVNTTPVGMHPRAGESALDARELNCRLVFDLVYRPMKTKLLRLAERRGIETVSGVEMFIAQGTAQWEIWTGMRAPVAAMRKAVLAALRKEGGRRGTP